MPTDHKILFQLDRPGATVRLDYTPWATRTLKVEIKTNKEMPALRVRPKGIRPDELKAGVFRAFPDNDNSLIISWGGGHEPGPCVRAKDFLKAFEQCQPVEPGSASVLFFNLTHIGPAVPDAATMTLEAFEEKTNRVYSTLRIYLQKPADFPANAMRLAQTKKGEWKASGDSMPTYDPRWWPGDVSYVPGTAESLTIRRVDNTLKVYWGERETAVITDHTSPTILDDNALYFDLFHFDEWHVALRLWFFWLDKNIGGGFFFGRHEVPDAERFDLLIRKRDGQVTLACTDLHWREMWGQVHKGEAMQATLGLNRETKQKLLNEEVGKLLNAWQQEKGQDYTEPYNPIEYISRLAAGLGPTRVVRGKGTEAHIPTIHNMTQISEPNRPSRMTSSDVRLG